jgi:hypothetical protein
MPIVSGGGGGSGGGVITVLSYVEFTSPVNTTATAEGSATTVVTAASVSPDGATRICVEFYCESAQTPGTSSGQIIIDLWQDSASIGRLAQVITASAASPTGAPVLVRRFFTPAAGATVFSVRAWVSPAGTGVLNAGSGTATTSMPGYIRVTKGG